MTPRPRLVTVAHGTRHRAGNLVARRITAAAGRRLGVPAVTSYVELSDPGFSAVMADNREPSVVVPLLLSTGHHLRHDLPRAISAAPVRVRAVHALGPHPLLAEVMAVRLLAVGARPGDPVVMVAAGTRDPAGAQDLEVAAGLLRHRWRGRVEVAVLGGEGARLAEQVAALRAGPGGDRLAVAPYLGASGHFQRSLVRQAHGLGVTRVAGVLGPHPWVVEVVVRRYRAALLADARSRPRPRAA